MMSFGLSTKKYAVVLIGSVNNLLKTGENGMRSCRVARQPLLAVAERARGWAVFDGRRADPGSTSPSAVLLLGRSAFQAFSGARPLRRRSGAVGLVPGRECRTGPGESAQKSV